MFRRKYEDRSAVLAGVAALFTLCGCTPPSAPDHEVATGPSATATSATSANDIAVFETSQPERPQRRAVPGEYLVKFKTGTSSAAVTRALKMAALDPVREFRSVPGLHLVRAGEGDAGGAAFKAALLAGSRLEYIEPNFIIHTLAVPNDPDYPRLWAMHNTGQTGGSSSYLPDISAEAAWDITTGSDDVVVAVIDSGVDYRHEDLAANIWSNPGECDADLVDDDGNGYVDDCHGIDAIDGDSDPMDAISHGTHVAGIIGAVGNNGVGIAGVAWRVKILPCRIFGDTGYGPLSGAVQCFDYLALLKERGVNLIASNNSWGFAEGSRALDDAIRAQLDHGILTVAAAGNDRLKDVDLIPEYPCTQEVASVICVASAYDRIDDFSNQGRSNVLLGAPGAGIYSTLQRNQYSLLSGTSMAAPHVTGALVLLKAQDPARDIWALRNLLAAGTVAPRDGAIPTITEGRLNLFNSLNCVNRRVLARLRPMNYAPLSRSPGDRVTIRALHVNCAAPAGDVMVTVTPGGEIVNLQDHGVGADEFAGDGIYSADWIAHGDGEYSFAFPAPETDTFKVEVDPDLKPGFPIRTNNLDGASISDGDQALVAGNITGDAQFEIASLSPVFGPLTLWNSRGVVLPGWPQYGSEDRFESGPAIGVTLGNLDADATTLEPIAQYFLGMHEYRADGTLIAGWPQALAAATLTFAAADLDGDGIDEILSYPARRADGSAFRADIEVPARIDAALGDPYAVRPADLDADGRLDLVGVDVSDSAPYLWISTADGLSAGFPSRLPGGQSPYAALRPLIGDVDGDGIPNIVVGSLDNRELRSQVLVLDNRGRLLRTLYMAPTGREKMALADVDGDGIPEIVRVANAEIGIQRGDGTFLPGWPRQFPGAFLASEPAIGDVDGDGEVDIVATGFLYDNFNGDRDALHAFHVDGSYLPGFPKTFIAEEYGASTPVIADIDLDGRNDLLVAFGRGMGLRETIFAYDLHGAGPYGRIEWSQAFGDARHTGYYQTGRNLPNHAFLATQVYGAGRITASDGGIDCRSDCIERYAKGTQVVLTATPLTAGAFRRWRGACANQGNPCTLPIQRFTETSADFDSRLTVSVTGEGTVTSDVSGILCPGDCDETFAGRSMVTLTAAEAASTDFTGWSGACSGRSRTCKVFIDDVKNAGASFASAYPLTVSKSGTGSAVVTSIPEGIDCGVACSANFAVGSRVTITVAPASDSYFVSWHRTGCVDSMLSCDVTMDGAVSLAPEVARKPVMTVTITGPGQLEVQPADITCQIECRLLLDVGPVTLNADAYPGAEFVRFEGVCSSAPSAPRCTHSMNADVSVRSVFRLYPVLTITRTGNGSGTIASTTREISCAANCTAAYPSGTVITLVATPEAGSSFGGWQGGPCSGMGNCVVTLNDGIAVNATFTRGGSSGGSSASGSSRGGGGGGSLDWWMLAGLALAGLAPVFARRRHVHPKGLSRESGGVENQTGFAAPMWKQSSSRMPNFPGR